MATLESTKLAIAGIGHVFYANPDTAPFDLKKFRFGDESTYGDWTWLGDTSSDALAEFSTDGGDTTTKRTWDRTNVRVIRGEETVSGTITSVNVAEETFKAAFANAVTNPAGYTDVTTSTASKQRALFLVMEDSNAVAGLYLPNTDLKGDFPTFSLEEFTSFPLKVSVLGSETITANGAPVAWRWYSPVTRG